jgi:hypothetical protein
MRDGTRDSDGGRVAAGTAALVTTASPNPYNLSWLAITLKRAGYAGCFLPAGPGCDQPRLGRRPARTLPSTNPLPPFPPF